MQKVGGLLGAKMSTLSMIDQEKHWVEKVSRHGGGAFSSHYPDEELAKTCLSYCIGFIDLDQLFQSYEEIFIKNLRKLIK